MTILKYLLQNHALFYLQRTLKRAIIQNHALFLFSEDFEKERTGLLEAVERCSVTQAELHRLEWDNRKRSEEVRELQKGLSDAQNFLFEERERLMTLQVSGEDAACGSSTAIRCDCRTGL